jgi:hypothetical protein
MASSVAVADGWEFEIDSLKWVGVLRRDVAGGER